MGKTLLLLVLSVLIAPGLGFSQNFQEENSETLPTTFIVKLKPATSDGRTASSPETLFQNLSKSIALQRVEKAFPGLASTNLRTTSGNLSNIYKIHLTNSADATRLLGFLRFSPLVEYAEPYIPNAPLYIPNDPQANPVGGQQDYLPVIKAHEAWDISKSDSTMVIGLVDTGVKMDHEDLGNIAFNYADPINGLDDDGDGYIDNFHGWDIADKDNNPTADGHPHGSYVVGMSSATVNNGKGMAGLGFYSKYLPVKIAETATQVFNNEYGGVVYAAEHGCGVINLSWGAAGNYTKYGQDVVNYAALEKDAVVVAAAGNTNASLNFYPASFDHVLSVGSTEMSDVKSPWATYGYAIDLMAPGNNVYTTNNAGTYGRTGGSSYSAPLVSGAAALVRSRFPALNALQVMEQLRVTADDIYSVGTNMDYYGQLGKGRLNVYRALTDTLTPAVRVSSYDYSAKFGKLLFPGDTVTIDLTFTNYLRIAENVVVTITNPSANTNWQTAEISLPKLQAMESFNLPELPLFVIDKSAESGDRILLRLDFQGDNYSDFQYLEMQVAPGYFDISDGQLTVTACSDGDIGYDDAGYTLGHGIGYLSNYIGTEAGLIISTDKHHVMDNVIRDIASYKADADFIAENMLKPQDNSTATMDARSSLKPVSNASALPLKIEQKVLAWDHPGEDGYVVFEYRLINVGDSAITGLNAAMYTDWDLGERKSNYAATLDDEKMIYISEKTTENLFAGVALLSDQSPAYYAIDLGDENGNVSDVGNTFSDSLKHAMITASSPKMSAGITGSGNDVAQLVGAKNITLAPGQSVKVALAMLASTSLGGLKNALVMARSDYEFYIENPAVALQATTCFGDSVALDPPGVLYEFFSDRELVNRLDSGMVFNSGTIVSDTVFYAVNIDSAYRSDIASLVVKTENPRAYISATYDSVDLKFNNTTVLTDLSENAASSFWRLADGSLNDAESLEESYDMPGKYTYELIAESPYGCRDTASAVITVFRITALEFEKNARIAVFPNPTEGRLNIRLTESSTTPIRCEMTDITGELLFITEIPTNTETFELNLKGWVSGIYFLRCGGEVWKIVKE